MAEIHWLNPVDGNFDTAADWSGDVVPGAADDAFIDAAGTTPYTVTVTVQQDLNTLTIASTATVNINALLQPAIGANNAGTIVVGQGGGFNPGSSGRGGLTNTGIISVEDGGGLGLFGTINNSGSINSIGSSAFISPLTNPCILTGGGVINLSDGIILGGLSKGNADYLTNVNNTIEGSGEITRSLVFINDAGGVVDANAKGRLTLAVGKLTISNAGLIEATNHGVCVIKSAVNNTGTLEADGGTLMLKAAVTGSGVVDLAAGKIVIANAGAAEAVAFTGEKGTLELTKSQTYAGSVSGFSRKGKTTLDLRDIGFVSSTEATFSGNTKSGVLTVSDGTHTAHITLIGNYTTATFVASSDGAGGVSIIDPSIPTPSIQHFAAAMATLTRHGGAAAGPIHAGADLGARQTMLAAPRIMTA